MSEITGASMILNMLILPVFLEKNIARINGKEPLGFYY